MPRIAKPCYARGSRAACRQRLKRRQAKRLLSPAPVTPPPSSPPLTSPSPPASLPCSPHPTSPHAYSPIPTSMSPSYTTELAQQPLKTTDSPSTADFDRICRACLTICSSGNNSSPSLLDDQVQEVFVRSTNIYVSFNNDGLPKNLCRPCLTKCTDFMEFKSMCDSNDRLLYSIAAKEAEEAGAPQPTVMDYGKVLLETFLGEIETGTADAQGLYDADQPLPTEVCVVERSQSPHDGLNDLGALSKARPLEESKLLHLLRKTVFNVEIKCPICSQSCKNSQDFEVHVREHFSKTKPVCPICHFTLKKWSASGLHMYKHTTQLFKCTRCDKQYKHPVSYMDHMRLAHGGEARIPNVPDAKTFHVQFMQSVLAEGVKCPVCPEYCEDNKAFRLHISSHTGTKDTTCPVCHRLFESIAKMRNHIYGHTKRRFHCPHCNKECNSPISIRDHLRMDHSGAERPSASDPMPLPAGVEHKKEDADKSDSDAGSDKEEVDPIAMEGEEEHKCTSCGDVFSKLANLKAHMEKKNHKSNFNCQICDDPFKSELDLVGHFKKKHMRDNKCRACSKVCKDKATVEKHVKLCHTVRNYSHMCKICNQGFVRADRLRDHAIIHSGEKPFQCKICEQRFRWKRNLLAHEKKVHTS